MAKKSHWLPFDERLIPQIISFKYPKSIWVRGMLALEMVIAVLVLVGTFVLVVMPPSSPLSKAATTTMDQGK